MPISRAAGRSVRLGGRGGQLPDEFLRDQLVAGGGEMDAIDAAQALRHAGAVLAVGGVVAAFIGDDGPQRHELEAVSCDRVGIEFVDVAHVLGVALAARDRVAEPQDAQPGGGETVEDPVDSRGVLGPPRLAAEAQRRAALAHVDAVVGAEHHDGDIGLLALGEGLDRRQPLVFVVHQRRAGVGAVEHAETRILGQHALQAAGEAGGLTIAEHDDGRRGRYVLCLGLRLGLRLRRRNSEEHDKQPGAHGAARAGENPNPPLHGVIPPRQHPRTQAGYSLFVLTLANRIRRRRRAVLPSGLRRRRTTLDGLSRRRMTG